MTTIRKLTVGGLAGLILTLGLGGIASAAPTSSVGATSTTTPSTTPSTTAPSTLPSSTTPSTTAPSSHHSTSAHQHVLTGPEIWRIVRPRHGISCTHAAKQIKRVKTAEAAAAKRMARLQSKASHQQSSVSPHATTRTAHTTGKVHGFQKLENDGQALIKRIEAKCPSAAPAV